MAARTRIVFMGTPDFAVPSLRVLLEKEEKVVCVITQPDRPRGRGRKLAAPPVKELALDASIPVLQPESVKGSDFLARLRSLQPDIICVTAYGKILPDQVVSLPPLGTINVHGSLLPKYRGAAPIQWALINGETETGVTIMQMDAGLDTGDILLQEKIPITPGDTAGTLSVKMAELGANALAKTLDLLRSGRLKPIPQNDDSASYAPLLTKEDGLVNWSEAAPVISCRIRGLDPWPASYSMLSGKRVRLFSPEVVETDICRRRDSRPGTICDAGRNGLLVATGAGCLRIREIQAEGARRMGIDAYLSGRTIEPGTVLG